jgi:hypothetical protein
MADGSRYLERAAEIIADQARANAAPWSVRIPPAMQVAVVYPVAYVSNSAPPAYPNEVKGVRHPVFGGRGTARPDAPWVTNEYRPFLAPAADQAGDAAADAFGDYALELAMEHGYR